MIFFITDPDKLFFIGGFLIGLLAAAVFFIRLSRKRNREGPGSNAAEEHVNLADRFKVYRFETKRPSVEWKVTEKDLVKRRRLKDIFDKSPNFVFIKDAQGYYQFVNRKFEEVYQVKAETIIGKTGYGVFPRETIDRWQAEDKKALQLSDLGTAEETIREKDGGVRTFLVTRFPIFDEQGEAPSLFGIGTDATRLKNYELILVQEKNKMSELLAKEKELDQARNEFVSMVSHELRAPMTTVKMAIGVILENKYGPVGESLRDVLLKISQYIDRLLNLVDDVLGSIRLETGVLKVNLQSLDLEPVIKSVADSLRVLAEGKKLSLEVKDVAAGKVKADPVLVGEILTNLISNAIKFTEKGGVQVSAQVKGGDYQIRVADTGRGIAEADWSKLFKRFQQISSKGQPHIAGTGLGLYLSKNMTELMGGQLCLEKSAVGRGSLFVLSLPLAQN